MAERQTYSICGYWFDSNISDYNKLGSADRKADHDCLFVVFCFYRGIIIRGGKNMDKEFVKMILSTKDENDDRLIKSGDTIEKDVLKSLCEAKIVDINKAFFKYEILPLKLQYFVHLCCEKCGSKYIKDASKTGILNIIKILRKYEDFSNTYGLCDECKKEKDKEEKHNREIAAIEHSERIRVNTENYISAYLDPNNSFKKGVKTDEKIDCIFGRYYMNKDENEIQNTIKSMSYSDFLKTPYWDGVRNYKLKKAHYRCELCNSSGVTLNVHHKTYENHGREHISIIANKDLIVLCKNCHEKFHDVLHKGV